MTTIRSKTAKKVKVWSAEHDKLYTRLYNLYVKHTGKNNIDKDNYIYY